MITQHHCIRKLMIITLLALLVGCSEPLSSDQIVWSPSTSNSCSGPCWHGLVIGKSSESDVMSILPTLTFIDQKTIQIYRGGTRPSLDLSTYVQGIEIDGRRIRPDQQCITLTVAGDVLTEIKIVLNYKIRLDQIINNLGNPDYVRTQLLGAETVTCEVEMIWKSKQLVISSEAFPWDSSNPKDNCVVVRDSGKPTSSLIISKVSYGSVQWVENILSEDGAQYFNFTGTISDK